MPKSAPQDTFADTLIMFTELLEKGSVAEVRSKLSELVPAEVAHLIASLPHEEREATWELVDPDIHGDVLIHLNDDVRRRLIRDMDREDLIQTTEGMETDDLADFLPDLPASVSARVMQSIPLL